jgi:hypothetical protein
MANLPRLKMASDRKKSIIDDSPAIFEIVDNPNAVNAAPFYEIEEASEIGKWCGIIIHLSQKHGVDSRLVEAIMYMETTHGWYDMFYPMRKTILPMNLHYKYWRELGVTKENLGCPFYNIEFGVILLARIQARIEQPTIAKIATIYNFLGAEKVNDYGARVAKLYIIRPRSKEGCTR